MKNNHNISLKKSNNNTINTGYLEQNFFSGHPMILNKTRLYDFCVKFAEIETINEPEYNIDLPSDINEKIEFNKLEVYKEIFSNVSHTLEDVEKILSHIPKRDLIIRKINGIYLNNKIEFNNVSKDKLCKIVFDEMLNTVNNSTNDTMLFLEDTYFAIQSLMYYAFTKCKILDKVPK